MVCGDDNFEEGREDTLNKLDFSKHISAIPTLQTNSIAQAIASLMQERAVGRNMYKSQGVFFEEAELQEIVEAAVRGYMKTKCCTSLLLRAYENGLLTFAATQDSDYIEKLPIFETVQPSGELAVSSGTCGNEYRYTFKNSGDIRGKLSTVLNILMEFEYMAKQQGVEISRLDEEQNVLLHKLECATTDEERYAVADLLYAHRQNRAMIKQQDELMKRLKPIVGSAGYKAMKEIMQDSLADMNKVIDDILRQDGETNA